MGRHSRPAPPISSKPGCATREVVSLTCPNSLEVAPELQGLEITARLIEAYNRLTAEGVSLFKSLEQQVSKQELPDRVLKDALRVYTNPKLDELMPRMREKAPLLHDFVVTLRHLVFIENLLQGEITEERLQKKRQKLHDFLTQLRFKYAAMERVLKSYQRRPRKRPAAKATRYLQALDYKNANPQTSWGQLAQKFCDGDPSQANTLKTWAYRKKKELAEIGIQIRLDNPDYHCTSPSRIRATAKP
jgi:hypothetical protein